MGDIKGFLKYTREEPQDRPVEERVHDWREVTSKPSDVTLGRQAARCMDCGIPFCHTGCPLGNLIPDWNHLVYRKDWREAIDRLHATNNFPEFTGRICPAPCEAACVLGIIEPPVTIKQIEKAIIDHAWDCGWIEPEPPEIKTGRKVAIVGSGPAGLAAAQQLRRAGHSVTVFERADRPGGLLMYGIPDFKLEKFQVERRIRQMEAEGVIFRTNCWVGRDVKGDELLREFDAIVLAGGATAARDLPIEGRQLKGIHFAMEFLTQQNKVNQGDAIAPADRILATDQHVVVIGGGDTGSDCVGTSVRHGAKSVTQIELLPMPPNERTENYPWPYYPMVLRTSSSHEEGCNRQWSVLTKRFTGDDAGNVRLLHCVELEWTNDDSGRMKMTEVAGSDFEIEADLVLLAMGFVGPEKEGLLQQLGVELDERGNVKADEDYRTSVDKVFVAGDMRRGQSLVVWALAEGREAARGVDEYLMGYSDLPTFRTRVDSLPRR
ncbi:MAG TPA: glutamate synthase subunit beta [Candidatus Sumerlaeota bacterium]|nr:glutamate synthase subunit beta [Candidatus Sumerlaeota bacterium]HOR28532.1 glutamate synthase subunit beta [Candidatus Sumerlaeota bacterium]HPK02028.1 glutamate synthase subunit beta [Candidatus Sumerlaeota bacterium]